MISVEPILREASARVDATLRRFLRGALATDRTPPARALGGGGVLHRALRYALFPGGKRLRPAVCYEAARALGAPRAVADEAAAALELVHSYSLVHDDLPCMDDAALRRGRRALHRVVGEAGATLAGDSLLTLAFEALASAPLPARARVECVRELSRAAGPSGMVAGQSAELGARRASVRAVLAIYRLKSGALFGAAAALGALCAGAAPRDVKRLRTYGLEMGVAFQLADDIEDIGERGLNVATRLGEARARTMGLKALDRAIAALRPLGPRGATLEALARFAATRAPAAKRHRGATR